MSAQASEFVRMGEPGLYPRGLLKDAPPPREIFVARVEHAEWLAQSIRAKSTTAAQAIARHQAAFDAWNASVEKNCDVVGALPADDALQHAALSEAWMTEQQYLLEYRPRSLAEVRMIAEHIRDNSLGIEAEDFKNWSATLASAVLEETSTGGVSAQVADAMARHSAAFNAWLEDAIDNPHLRNDDDEGSSSKVLADEWTKAEFWLLQIIPRSLADVVAVAKHILPHQQREHLQEDALADWLKALALARTLERPTAAVEQDPILSLIDVHREQQDAAYADGLDDEKADELTDIANATWWHLLETGPTTISGAVVYAEYVARLENEGVAPTNRVRGDSDTHTDVCAVALDRVAASLRGKGL